MPLKVGQHLTPEHTPNLGKEQSASAAVVRNYGHGWNQQFGRGVQRRLLVWFETSTEQQHVKFAGSSQRSQCLLGARQYGRQPAMLAAKQSLHHRHDVGVGAHSEDAHHGRLGLNGRRKLGQQGVEFGTEFGVDQPVFRVKRFFESGQGHVPGNQRAVARESLNCGLKYG